MSAGGIAAEAEAEVLGFHAFLARWLGGSAAPGEAAVAETLERFDARFLCIDPEGRRQTRDDLCAWLHAAHGSVPALEIRVAKLEILWCSAEAALLGYEEHQAGPAANARRAVALFRSDRGQARWVHVSEAWLGDGGAAAAGQRALREAA
jgi:hypothetical protein